MTGRLSWAEALRLARRGTPNDRLRTWAGAASSAVAAALVCMALTLWVLAGDPGVTSVIGVVSDPGTRGGVAFAVALVAVPALFLTGQTWRLGSVERRERVGQLTEAGASPRDLRRLVVVDTAAPVVLGGVVGVAALGLAAGLVNANRESFLRGEIRLDRGVVVTEGTYWWPTAADAVPNPVTSVWWAAPVAVAAVTLLASAVAARSVRRARRPRLVPSPLGVTAAAGARRVRGPALLLALRRLAAEPRVTSRPAAILALAVFVGVVSAWARSQFRTSAGEERWNMDPYYSQAFDLIRVSTAVGVLLCALGLVVALGDATVRRRRADAAALASGVPLRVLRQALVLQVVLPTVPAVTVAAVLGRWALSWLGQDRVEVDGRSAGPRFVLVPAPWLEWSIWVVGALVVACAAALLASTLLARTTRLDQLRVPA